MTLTADQVRWLESSKIPCALFKVTFLGSVAGVATELHAWLSTVPFVSRSTDTPAHQIFEAAIVEPPSITVRMSEQLDGRSTLTYSDLIVANPAAAALTQATDLQSPYAGERDAWLQMNWDGRRIEGWVGDPGWAFANFIKYLDGVTLDSYDAGGMHIGLKISDKGGYLDRPIMLSTIGGTGPDANAVMPLLYGLLAVNFEPKLKTAATHTYKLTGTDVGGLVEALSDGTFGVDFNPLVVFEDGADLSSSGALVATSFGSDWFEVTAHGGFAGTRFRLLNLGGATAPTPFVFNTDYWIPTGGIVSLNRFTGALTQGGAVVNMTADHVGSILVQFFNYTRTGGEFSLVASPEGRITATMTGLRVGGTVVSTAGGIAEQALTSGMTNTLMSAVDLDAASLAAFKALCPQTLGISIADRMTFVEFLDKLVLSVGGWWSFSRAGKLIFGRLDLPTGTSVYTISAGDVVERSYKRVRRILPKKQITLRADRNFAPLTAVAGSVGEAARVGFMREWIDYIGVASSVPTWRDDPEYHLRATAPPAVESYIVIAGQQAEATRIADLYQYPTAVDSVDTGQIAVMFDLGDEIELDHPRYAGNAIVVGVTFRVFGKSTIEFFHQNRDTYPTADL